MSIKSNKNLRKTLIRDKETVKKNECQHQKTIAINEEGNAGIFCVDCGEQIEKEC